MIQHVRLKHPTFEKTNEEIKTAAEGSKTDGSSTKPDAADSNKNE